MDKRLSTIVALVVITAWSVSFIVDILSKAYEPPPTIHALMMIVAGAVFGNGLIKTKEGQ